jgi:hypothetical protein
MRQLLLAALLALLSACADDPSPHHAASSQGPDNPAAPSANLPYRPVMAGTAWHGVGDRP